MCSKSKADFLKDYEKYLKNVDISRIRTHKMVYGKKDLKVAYENLSELDRAILKAEYLDWDRDFFSIEDYILFLEKF